MNHPSPAHYSPRSGAENGFLMIEAVMAIALIGLCAGAMLAAVLAVEHQSRAQPASALAACAQNVLTDLRAATAYDAAQLAALPGRSAAFDVIEPGPDGSPRALHVFARAQLADTGAVAVSVTVLDDSAHSATVQSSLVQEAPAPRSVMAASRPAPPSDPAP